MAKSDVALSKRHPDKSIVVSAVKSMVAFLVTHEVAAWVDAPGARPVRRADLRPFLIVHDASDAQST